MVCGRCGTATAPGVTSCATCGAPVPGASAPDAQARRWIADAETVLGARPAESMPASWRGPSAETQPPGMPGMQGAPTVVRYGAAPGQVPPPPPPPYGQVPISPPYGQVPPGAWYGQAPPPPPSSQRQAPPSFGHAPPPYGQAQPPYGQVPPWAPPGQAPPMPPYSQTPPRPAFSFEIARWSQSDRITAIASACLLLSLFAPWFKYSVGGGFGLVGYDGSASGLKSHAYLYLVLLLSAAVVIYFILQAGYAVFPYKLPASRERLLLAATGINLLLVLVGFFSVPGMGSGVGSTYGAYIGIIAAIAACAPQAMPYIRAQANGNGQRG